MTIFLGLMVGWVVLAVFTPIYGTFDDIAI